MSEPRLPDLAPSFERHLRAENKSDRSIEIDLEAFLAGQGIRLADADLQPGIPSFLIGWLLLRQRQNRRITD